MPCYADLGLNSVVKIEKQGRLVGIYPAREMLHILLPLLESHLSWRSSSIRKEAEEILQFHKYRMASDLDLRGLMIVTMANPNVSYHEHRSCIWVALELFLG